MDKFTINDTGSEEISPPNDIGGSPDPGNLTGENEKQHKQIKSGSRGRRYSDFLKDDGVKEEKAPPSDFIPRIGWFSR